MIKKNSEYDLTITGFSHEGYGVGRIGELVVFVPNTIIGETIRVRIIKIKKNYAVGKLMEIVEKSEFRQEPFCEAYKKCGGCGLQHIKYEQQLFIKTKIVIDSLNHIALLTNIKVNDCIGMEKPYEYRNKIQYPVKRQGGNVAIGFFEKRSHDIVEAKQCYLHRKDLNRIRIIMKYIIEKYKISIYDEETGKGLLRHILIKEAFSTNERMLILVINGKKLIEDNLVLNEIINDIVIRMNFNSIVLNLNQKKSNVILGDRNLLIHGKNNITDIIGDYKFEISAKSFYQTNPVQMKKMYDKIIEFANFKGNEVVLDIYCGIGTIGIYIAKYVDKVYGIELVKEAIKNAKENVKINDIKNVEFIEGEAVVKINEFVENGLKADVIILDPPRKGCEQSLLESIVAIRPERIIYVSCNPSTLARDLKYFCEFGYEAKYVQPLDMFPHTMSIESISLLERECEFVEN